MLRRYNLALAMVVLLGLTTLMVGVDAHAQIAFTCEKNGNEDIYVMDTDGGNRRRLTNSPRNEWSPVWSPDGERIAFVSNEDIYVMDADGQNHRKLTNNRHGGWAPSWAPDGKRIAFSSKRGADWNKRDGDWDIYVMDADGGNIQNLTNNPLAHDGQPAWFRPAFSVAPAGKQFTMWGWLKQVAR